MIILSFNIYFLFLQIKVMQKGMLIFFRLRLQMQSFVPLTFLHYISTFIPKEFKSCSISYTSSFSAIICSTRISFLSFSIKSFTVSSKIDFSALDHSRISACRYDLSIRYTFFLERSFRYGIDSIKFLSICSLFANLYILLWKYNKIETMLLVIK
mgnify:CR=1 FL=1